MPVASPTAYPSEAFEYSVVPRRQSDGDPYPALISLLVTSEFDIMSPAEQISQPIPVR